MFDLFAYVIYLLAGVLILGFVLVKWIVHLFKRF